MKYFDTSADIAEMAQEKFGDTSLQHMGINLNLISIKKSKNILKISKTNEILKHLTDKDLVLTVYEEAFDRLPDEMKWILLEGCLSNVSYDTEKDKLNVESDIAKEIFRMRKKYANYVDMLETAYLTVLTIEEEEKQRKEEEKQRKAEEKAAKRRNNG